MRASALDPAASTNLEHLVPTEYEVRKSPQLSAETPETNRDLGERETGSDARASLARIPKTFGRDPMPDVMGNLGPSFRERAAHYDASGHFVHENYAELKQTHVISAPVPVELGGGGASHAEICQSLRHLAQFCGSTALALSMHMHLLAAAVYRYRHGQPAEALLRKIAASEVVLVSTGAGDWIDSVGSAERVSGGYRVNAVKRFCSGCEAGGLLMSSAPYQDDELGPMVMHFALPLPSPGVTILDDWSALGMRGTGSHSIELKDAFVPESAISVRRPRGAWHPAWAVTIGVAAPIYMAPYVGIAERAAALALEHLRHREPSGITLQLVGELTNALTLTQVTWRDMIVLCNEYDFVPSVEQSSAQLVRKTIVTKAAKHCVSTAVELVGGSAFFRQNELERLWRDVQAATFHLLPEKKQLDFTGRAMLGVSPIS